MGNLALLSIDVEDYIRESEIYSELMQNISKALAESGEIEVQSPDDLNTAAFYIKNFKLMERKLEDFRKIIKQPIVEKGREVDEYFKYLTGLFTPELKRLESEVLAMNRRIQEEARRKAEEERKRLEEEAIQRAIAEEERRRSEAQRLGIDVKSIPTVEPGIVAEIIPQTIKLSQMNTSGLTSRKTKSIEIVNINLIPREYLMVDEQKIKAERNKYPALNDDGSEIKSTIPGIRFTYKESLS